jgi:hypothetical protein
MRSKPRESKPPWVFSIRSAEAPERREQWIGRAFDEPDEPEDDRGAAGLGGRDLIGTCRYKCLVTELSARLGPAAPI